MHTLTVGTSTGSETTVFHNGDFSGRVVITAPADELDGYGDQLVEVVNDKEVIEVAVDFEILKRIVAAWLRDKRISALEEASDDDVLEGLV